MSDFLDIEIGAQTASNRVKAWTELLEEQSHFGRVFKERYGMAPRDAKHLEQ